MRVDAGSKRHLFQVVLWSGEATAGGQLGAGGDAVWEGDAQNPCAGCLGLRPSAGICIT